MLSRYQVKITYAYPERLAPTVTEDGRRVVGRIPAHPTRPARAWEPNCWWEDADAATAAHAHAEGHAVRMTPAAPYDPAARFADQPRAQRIYVK